MRNPIKIEAWNGKNKTRVRLTKKHEIQSYIEDEKDYYDKHEDWKPDCLTLAGASATLERLLVNHDLIDSKNIVTIQTYERLSNNHFGKDILKALMKTRVKYLPNMYIWPYNLQSFASCYTSEGCSKPSNNTTAAWAKPPYAFLMNKLCKEKTKRFGVADIDLCGIFNKKNAKSIENLFKNKVLDNRGIAFITHQKGRDVRGGKLFEILHDYLKTQKIIDFKSIPDIYDPDKATYVARYILIPLYYICKAYENNYALELTRLIEYRDKNDSSGLAVNMLQYFFKWSKTDTLKEPFYNVRDFIKTVMDEEYNYHSWID